MMSLDTGSRVPARHGGAGATLLSAALAFTADVPDKASFLRLWWRQQDGLSQGTNTLNADEWGELIEGQGRLAHALTWQLRHGELEARGFRTGDVSPIAIERDWWLGAEIDLRANTATNHGITFSGVLVKRPGAIPAAALRADLARVWVAGYLTALRSCGGRPNREDEVMRAGCKEATGCTSDEVRVAYSAAPPDLRGLSSEERRTARARKTAP